MNELIKLKECCLDDDVDLFAEYFKNMHKKTIEYALKYANKDIIKYVIIHVYGNYAVAYRHEFAKYVYNILVNRFRNNIPKLIKMFKKMNLEYHYFNRADSKLFIYMSINDFESFKKEYYGSILSSIYIFDMACIFFDKNKQFIDFCINDHNVDNEYLFVLRHNNIKILQYLTEKGVKLRHHYKSIKYLGDRDSHFIREYYKTLTSTQITNINWDFLFKDFLEFSTNIECFELLEGYMKKTPKYLFFRFGVKNNTIEINPSLLINAIEIFNDDTKMLDYLFKRFEQNSEYKTMIINDLMLLYTRARECGNIKIAKYLIDKSIEYGLRYSFPLGHNLELNEYIIYKKVYIRSCIDIENKREQIAYNMQYIIYLIHIGFPVELAIRLHEFML